MSYVALATHATAAALAAALTWGFLDARHDAAIGEMRVEQADAQLREVTRVRGEERGHTSKYQGALNASRNRQGQLRAAADAARAERDGLRDDLAEADRRIATASAAAVREYARATNAVFDDCSRAYQELAGQADGHVDDVRTLTDAWPVTATPAP